jgi:hypothetical protein
VLECYIKISISQASIQGYQTYVCVRLTLSHVSSIHEEILTKPLAIRVWNTVKRAELEYKWSIKPWDWMTIKRKSKN